MIPPRIQGIARVPRHKQSQDLADADRDQYLPGHAAGLMAETSQPYGHAGSAGEEVAEALGIAVSSASERLKRAKEKLRYALREAYFNE